MAAPTVPFPRILNVDVSAGKDVVAVKRAISRAGLWPWTTFNGTYTAAFAKAVGEFQKQKGMGVSGIYGKATHDKLRNTRRDGVPDEWAFDAEAIKLMQAQMLILHPVDAELATAKKMLAYCRQFDGPYVYGGEHDSTLADDTPHGNYDCSSSTSLLFYHFGLLGSTRAQVSEWFESWGLAGRGNYVTVHANGDHVWTEFSMPEGYYRFDTSPHGDGPRGPRVRTRSRPDSGFVHRHPKGM